MADLEERLVSVTGKGQYSDELNRIYENIRRSKDDPLTEHKTTFIMASLLRLLIEKHVISGDEVDKMLLDAQ